MPARRFLALAGERALGLDTAQAEARLARALELPRPRIPSGRTCSCAGRTPPSRPAGYVRRRTRSTRRSTAFRARGENVAARTGADPARASPCASARAGRSRSPPRRSSCSSRGRPARRSSPPTRELAGANVLNGAYAEAIAAADHALALAEKLGLPEPARALGFRGFARAFLGDPDGLAEMERALALLLEQGAGWEAAVLQNNLAIARYPLQGPARSLAAFEQAIAFCEQRGLAGQAAHSRPTAPAYSSSSAAPRRRSNEPAGSLPPPRRAAKRDSLIGCAPSSSRAASPAASSTTSTGRAEWLIETATQRATADVRVAVLAPRRRRLASEEPERARALLAEIEQTPGARDNPYYSRQLAAMLRTTLAAGDPDLAQRLTDGLEPRYPLREHALCAARAQLAEHAGDHAQAASPLCRSGRTLAAVRQRPRTRLCTARPGPLPARARQSPSAEVPLREARGTVQLDGLPPRPRRDRGATPADDRRRLLEQKSFCYRL